MSQSKFPALPRRGDREVARPQVSASRCLHVEHRFGWQPAVAVTAVAICHAALLYAFSRPSVLIPARAIPPLTVTIAAAAKPTHRAQKAPSPSQTRTSAAAPMAPAAATAAPSIAEAASAVSPAEAVASTAATTESTAISAPRFDAAYLNNPPPSYPASSRRLGEEGRVVLRVFVTAEGRTNDIRIERSSGYARLDRAATDAVSRWRFVPAAQLDRPVGAWVLVPISFALKQG